MLDSKYMALQISQNLGITAVTAYGLDGWDSIPSSGRKFCLCCCIQTDFRIHPAYLMATGGSLPWRQSRHSVKLTTYFHLLRSRKHEILFPHTPTDLQGAVATLTTTTKLM